jgi:hypothetical protein
MLSTRGIPRMAEMDLLEQTRRDDSFKDINEIVDKLNQFNLFPSLVWVYVWDVIVDKYNNAQWDAVLEEGWEDYAVPQGLGLKVIWDKLWEDADSLGLTLEYGTEDLMETIDEWLKDSLFLIPVNHELDGN